MGEQIDTIDHDLAANYYFQDNRDGSARVRRELRYARSLWNTCAQLQVRLPFMTKYPAASPSSSSGETPYSGFGNAELRYYYGNVAPTFDHSIEVGAAFPTETNGVVSNDTQLKFFYNLKWKWDGGSVAYSNEYDQTVIRPPGAGDTSYYEGLLTLPAWSFADSPAWRGLKLSAIYDYRVLFSDNDLYQSAVGGIMSGTVNDFAINVTDSWGIGPYGLWKYRVEATAAVRL